MLGTGTISSAHKINAHTGLISIFGGVAQYRAYIINQRKSTLMTPPNTVYRHHYPHLITRHDTGLECCLLHIYLCKGIFHERKIMYTYSLVHLNIKCFSFPFSKWVTWSNFCSQVRLLHNNKHANSFIDTHVALISTIVIVLLSKGQDLWMELNFESSFK